MNLHNDILFFCPRWGSEALNWPDFFAKARDAGYDGIEYAVSREVSLQELDLVWNQSALTGMPVIAQHYDTDEADFKEHRQHYLNWFNKMEPYKPMKINTQTGKDHFPMFRNAQLINLAREFSERTGIPVVHETHRGKFSFAAHVTTGYLTNSQTLRLTLDASHWVNVAESLLQDQQLAMEMAISRTDHIHARIGHPEGPQVPDPRMKEWQPALQAHLNWWDKIAGQKRREAEVLTITTEFGPFPYMVNLPASGKPITDQWEANVYMLDLLKTRYRI